MALKDFARRVLACVVALSLAATALVALPGCDTTPAVDVLAEHIEEVGKETEDGSSVYVEIPYVAPADGSADSAESNFPTTVCSAYSYDDYVSLTIVRYSLNLGASGLTATAISIPTDGGSDATLTHAASVVLFDSQYTSTGTATIDIPSWDGTNDIEFDTFETEGDEDGSIEMGETSPEGNFTDSARVDVNSLLASLDSYLEDEELDFDVTDLGFSAYQVEA